jgi:HD-GYP domain-containing protein (c-di-GMP phosphodiesterase class II)
VTSPFASIVRESQTPWEQLKSIHGDLKAPYQIGQIVHLADAVSLLLNGETPVINQIGQVRQMIHCGEESEFSPEVLSAFDLLCTRESVWMDMIYRPQFFLDLITDNRWITLDETVVLTEFMSKVVDFRSPFTAMHSAGVATTAVALAEIVGMSEEECKLMRIAGNLHDIGKLKIPNEILDKPGKLTDEEFNIMKEHAYYTWILLKDITGFQQISAWAALHHEKLNGNGYPFHLADSELPLGSRIMTIADIFSALTEERPYRRGMEKEKVIAILREDAQKGLLASGVVELLVKHYDQINKRRAVESKAASKKYQEILAHKGL